MPLWPLSSRVSVVCRVLYEWTAEIKWILNEDRWMTSLLSWSHFIYYQHALLSSPAESCQFVFQTRWGCHLKSCENITLIPSLNLKQKPYSSVCKKPRYVCNNVTVYVTVSSCCASVCSVFCSALFGMGRDGWGGLGSWKEQCRCEQLHPTVVLLQEWHPGHRWHLGRGEEESVVIRHMCVYVFCFGCKIQGE